MQSFHVRAHQSHYEQFGDLKGEAVVDGTPYKLDLHVMRDHTHGSTRDWRLMHRYGIQHFKTENGFRLCFHLVGHDAISATGSVCRAFMGIVSQPSTFTQLELGYAFIPGGKNGGDGKVVPVTEVDLRLWAFGEMTGEDPKDFGFRFKADGEWHDVQVCRQCLFKRPRRLLKFPFCCSRSACSTPSRCSSVGTGRVASSSASASFLSTA